MAMTSNLTLSISDNDFPLSAILPMMTSTMMMCLFCQSNVTLEAVMRNLNTGSITFILGTTNGTLSSECINIMFVDFSAVDVSQTMSTVPNMSWKFKIYIVLSKDIANISNFEQITPAFKSADAVVGINNKLYHLSSPLDKTRYFSSAVSNKVVANKDLDGRVIPVTFFTMAPWIITTQVNDSIKIDGMEVRLFNDLAGYLNFSWTHHKSKPCREYDLAVLARDNWHMPGEWGRRHKNGSWRCGVNFALDMGDAELSFGNFMFRVEGIETRDIGPTITDLYSSYIVRRPELNLNRWETIVKLFSPAVWTMVFVTFVVASMAYWGANHFKISLFDSGFTMYGLLIMAGEAKSRPNTAHILNWWSIFTLLITTAFTSSIIIRFTLPVYAPRIDTYKQLVEHGHVLVGNLNIKNNHISNKLNAEDRPWHRKFLETAIGLYGSEIKTRASFDDKMTLPAAKIGSDTVIPYWAAQQIEEEYMSKYRLLKEYVYSTFSTFVFRKDSAVFPTLSGGIQRLMEAGLWEHHKKSVMLHWASPAVRRLPEEHDRPEFEDAEKLTLFKLKPVFLVLVAGLSLATLAFIAEHIRFYLKEGKWFFQATCDKGVPEPDVEPEIQVGVLEDCTQEPVTLEDCTQVHVTSIGVSDLLNQPSTSKTILN